MHAVGETGSVWVCSLVVAGAGGWTTDAGRCCCARTGVREWLQATKMKQTVPKPTKRERLPRESTPKSQGDSMVRLPARVESRGRLNDAGRGKIGQESTDDERRRRFVRLNTVVESTRLRRSFEPEISRKARVILVSDRH